nr:hypothetical protein CFP56_54760 [Quercus suber]
MDVGFDVVDGVYGVASVLPTWSGHWWTWRCGGRWHLGRELSMKLWLVLGQGRCGFSLQQCGSETRCMESLQIPS